MNIPQSWIKTNIGNICITTSGGTPSRKKLQYFSGDVAWLKSGELKDEIIFRAEESITIEGIKNSSAKLLPPGTLLVALYGATVGKLGILGIPAATNQAVCAIKTPDEIEKRYLFLYLKYIRNDLLNKRIGGAQPNISQQIIRQIEFPLPPLPEQQHIVAKIEELFSRLDAGVA
ncbi:MAG: restriction endonuclease subunit S, partial [archaeon]